MRLNYTPSPPGIALPTLARPSYPLGKHLKSEVTFNEPQTFSFISSSTSSWVVINSDGDAISDMEPLETTGAQNSHVALGGQDAGLTESIVGEAEIYKQLGSGRLSTIMASAVLAAACLGNVSTGVVPVRAETITRPYSPREEIKPRLFKRTDNDFSNDDKVDKPSETDWYNTMINQLDKIVALEENWDSYGASAPNSFSAESAAIILAALKESSMPIAGIVPSPEGGIGIVFYEGDKYADFEIFNDGDILAATDDRQGTPIVWELNDGMSDVPAAINKIRQFLYG